MDPVLAIILGFSFSVLCAAVLILKVQAKLAQKIFVEAGFQIQTPSLPLRRVKAYGSDFDIEFSMGNVSLIPSMDHPMPEFRLVPAERAFSNKSLHQGLRLMHDISSCLQTNNPLDVLRFTPAIEERLATRFRRYFFYPDRLIFTPKTLDVATIKEACSIARAIRDADLLGNAAFFLSDPEVSSSKINQIIQILKDRAPHDPQIQVFLNECASRNSSDLS